VATPALLLYPFGMRILLAILATTGLFGHVSRGPTTPVCIQEVPCSAPVAGALMQFSRKGVVVAKTLTGTQGEYRVALRPGVYLVRLLRGGKPMLHFSSQYVHVPAGAPLRVDFAIDTGIR
jgi:hypothetical protein